MTNNTTLFSIANGKIAIRKSIKCSCCDRTLQGESLAGAYRISTPAFKVTKKVTLRGEEYLAGGKTVCKECIKSRQIGDGVSGSKCNRFNETYIVKVSSVALTNLQVATLEGYGFKRCNKATFTMESKTLHACKRLQAFAFETASNAKITVEIGNREKVKIDCNKSVDDNMAEVIVKQDTNQPQAGDRNYCGKYNK